MCLDSALGQSMGSGLYSTFETVTLEIPIIIIIIIIIITGSYMQWCEMGAKVDR